MIKAHLARFVDRSITPLSMKNRAYSGLLRKEGERGGNEDLFQREIFYLIEFEYARWLYPARIVRGCVIRLPRDLSLVVR